MSRVDEARQHFPSRWFRLRFHEDCRVMNFPSAGGPATVLTLAELDADQGCTHCLVRNGCNRKRLIQIYCPITKSATKMMFCWTPIEEISTGQIDDAPVRVDMIRSRPVARFRPRCSSEA